MQGLKTGVEDSFYSSFLNHNIYRQAESLDHDFSLPINIFLKSLKLGKILKIYYAKLVYYLMINIYIQCCVYAITLHTSLMNTHTHIYLSNLFSKSRF